MAGFGGRKEMKHAIAFASLLSVFAAAGNDALLFEVGTGNSYRYASTVILNEPAERKGKDVGYQVKGDVSLGVVWQGNLDENEKLLEIELKQPKLLVQSKKGETFDVHKSRLDTIKGYPVLLHRKNGKIIHVYTDDREESSLENFKKGIASLFQFQVTNVGEVNETDSSGNCLVAYETIDSTSFSKTKQDCNVLNPIENGVGKTDSILGGKMNSSRTSTYKLSEDLSELESVTSFEQHELIMRIEKESGTLVSANQILARIGEKHKVKVLESSSLENAVQEFANSRKLNLKRGDLQLREFSADCDKEDCPSLPKLLKENRKYLSDSNLGTFKSASAFVKLISAGRKSSKDDLVKAFKGTKNKEILTQLCDLAGAIQTEESHKIIMKLINFDADQDFDASERYLWALATGSNPKESVLRDIFKISQRPRANDKLDETLILTLASMARKFNSIPENKNNSITDEITNSILADLENCKVDESHCKIKYLRALKNLKNPETLSVLMSHALGGTSKTRVEAMKGIRSFEPSHWTENVIDLAQRIYFQAGKKYDSSSRTLALDILLESNPRREILEELLLSLVHRDPAYEVKQYLVQRVNQISEKNERFSGIVKSIKNRFHSLLKNYNVEAQRGLTTAFERNFATDHHRNGSLATVLEISRGLLKRGIVDVVIEDSERSTSLFTLGLFADGLTSFLSSDGDDEEVEEVDADDVTTAGMELTVLGSQIRPFTFFRGQSELMGHVWSGTASEKTPAYQAIVLVIDYRDRIPLQNGFLVQTEVLGAVSFDLSGQIQISIWNKNAHSLVEKSGGISLVGQTKVDSSFVRSNVEFTASTEVKLNLISDLNFYGGNFLCMQLSQPEAVIKRTSHKIEKIPGEKHRLRRSKYSQVKMPGRTFVLNKKNNEMCNILFNEV